MITEQENTGFLKPNSLQSRRPLIVGLIVLILLLLIYAIVLRPRLSASSALLRITPASQTITNNFTHRITVGDADPAKNPFGAHRLTGTTSTQSMKVPATGKGHQDAAIAQGTVAVTIRQGQLTSNTDFHIKSNSGVEIVFSLLKYLQIIGNGPAQLQAYAANPGANGNISAYDISGTYTGVQNPSLTVFVQNTQPFTGGQDAGDYAFVQQSDINTTASTLENQLADPVYAIKAAIQSQLPPNEQFIDDIQCNLHTTSNHHENDRVQDVTVNAAIECTRVAYDVGKLSDLATRELSQNAASQLGAGYALVGKVVATIPPITATGDTAEYKLSARGVWVFQISETLKQRFVALIVGQPETNATTLLLKQRGIAAVSIQPSGGSGTALPSLGEHIQTSVLNVKGL